MGGFGDEGGGGGGRTLAPAMVQGGRSRVSRAHRNKMIISLKLSSRYSRSFRYSRMDPSASLEGSPSPLLLDAAAACERRRSAVCCSSSSRFMLAVPLGEALLGVPTSPVGLEDSGTPSGSVAARVALAAVIASSAAKILSRLGEGAGGDSPT